jgi:hypothetical protein
MGRFRSLYKNCKLTPLEVAEMCEQYATEQMNIYELSVKYGLARSTINNYINDHYHGIIPKHRQATIRLGSKVNDQN